MSSENTVERNDSRRNWLFVVLVLVLLAIGAAIVLAAMGVLAFIPTTVSTTSGSDATPREVWQAQEITDYRYTLQVGCFCPEEIRRPVVIEVRDGQVATITYADDGTAANPEFFSRYSTAEQLFTVIDEAEAQNAVMLDVTYNEVGFPTTINIDISELMADEELYLTITEFESL